MKTLTVGFIILIVLNAGLANYVSSVKGTMNINFNDNKAETPSLVQMKSTNTIRSLITQSSTATEGPVPETTQTENDEDADKDTYAEVDESTAAPDGAGIDSSMAKLGKLAIFIYILFALV
jgi:hypothetical protein